MVCRRRGLKVNADEIKGVVLGGEKGLSESKYLRGVLDESSTDAAEYRRKEVSGIKVSGATRSLVRRCYMRHSSGLFCCMAVRQ